MFGILNLNKPAGWTSRDVVNRVQRLVRPTKVGHAGTLDPLATGVLVVCLGPATRLIPYVQEMPKVYQATFLLGCTSDSDDTETEVRPLTNPLQPTRAEINQKLPDFLGRISQRPPAYSAIKIQGQRAYKLARRGQLVKLQARPVEIYGLEITAYSYPTLKMTIRCGTGTYVRSLGRDLAQSLGTAAVMSALTRTAIGEFLAKDAGAVEPLNELDIASRLHPASCAVNHLPQVTLDAKQIEEIRHGRMVQAFSRSVKEPPPLEVAAMDENGQLVAILREKQAGMLGPVRNFPSSG